MRPSPAFNTRANPSRPPRTTGVLSESRKCKIRDLIERRIGDHLTIEDMAAGVDLSPYHFARRFKASFGVSPHQYVLRCRIERALEALKSSPGHSISDIALELGFVSQAHFAGAFRRFTGTTPAAWRKS
jgi:AraC family transcriptional regulator